MDTCPNFDSCVNINSQLHVDSSADCTFDGTCTDCFYGLNCASEFNTHGNGKKISCSDPDALSAKSYKNIKKFIISLVEVLAEPHLKENVGNGMYPTKFTTRGTP